MQDQPHSNMTTSPGLTMGKAGASFAGDITFADVGFAVHGRDILNAISLRFQAGKVTCLLGESGCGKTTVLRLAAGVLRPTAGSIAIDGMEMAGPSGFVPPERRNVGLMFQDYALFPHLSVLQNVTYGLYNLSRAEARLAGMRALERVGLGHMAGLYPNRLSGGEQQRVALARAIVPRPQVLLMDEPFSGLDMRLRERVRADALAIVRETRATAVLVTHDPMEAMEFADYIYLMKAGRIVQHGTPEQLYRSPASVAVARFFDSFNQFSGRARKGIVELPIGNVSVPEMDEGQAVDVLVRPNGIGLAEGHTGFEAYVLSARALAGRVKLNLMVQGLEDPVQAVVSGRQDVAVGQSLRFVMDPRGALVFKKETFGPI
jgi:iron(III) transport system ATP-binding protein